MNKNFQRVLVFSAIMSSSVLAMAEGSPLFNVPAEDVAQLKSDFLAACGVILSIVLVSFGVKWVYGLFGYERWLYSDEGQRDIAEMQAENQAYDDWQFEHQNDSHDDYSI